MGFMRTTIESRAFVSAALGTAVGLAASYRWPFAADDPFLQLVLFHKPYLFYGIQYAYWSMLFTTPYLLFSALLSLTYIFVVSSECVVTPTKLPPYPELRERESLY